MSVRQPRSVRDFVHWAEQRFEAAGLYFGHGTERALDEAAWIVGSALGLAPDELDAHLRDALDPAQQRKVRALVEARIRTRKPAAYLLHEAYFAGLRFYVDEHVLVPRSLTAEFIVERFEPWIDAGQVRRALDLGTGSGCIAIALAHAFPAAHIDASDVSPLALRVAQINVERYALEARVRLVESDLFDKLQGQRYDLIVTNPPYVAAPEMLELPEEYRHEPTLALVSGESGLHAITRILAAAEAHLTAHGILVAEVGNSAVALQERFPDVPFTWLNTASGDESVFLLTAAQLRACRPQLAATAPAGSD